MTGQLVDGRCGSTLDIYALADEFGDFGSFGSLSFGIRLIALDAFAVWACAKEKSMTMMIAIGTVHGRRPLRAGEIVPGNRKATGVELIAKPGEQFDTTEYGIDAAEEQSLVDHGAAYRENDPPSSARKIPNNPPQLGN